MCGIVYVNRKDGKPANRSVRKRYYAQKGRGTSGFGYVAIKDNEVVSYKRAPTEHEIMQELQKETAPEILFHHRFPTSTPNMEEQAHPLFIKGGNLGKQYFVAHNGVIRNANTRKTAHESLGFKYLTELKPYYKTALTERMYEFGDAKFNDSEALAVDTALALEGFTKNINSEGPAAVVGLIVDGTQVIDRFFYRNRANPLKYHTDKDMTTLTSMGKGTDVEDVNVMRMNADGTFEQHPLKVWTPWVYRDTTPTYQTRLYGGAPTIPALPLNSYNNTRTPQEHLKLPVSIDLGDDLRLDFSEGKATFLNQMTEESLWAEAERVHLAKISLAQSLNDYDTRVNSVGSVITLDVLDGRTKLQGRLDRINEYESRITTELLRREAINPDIAILRGSEVDRILEGIDRDTQGYD